jgi:hypothetical protein
MQTSDWIALLAVFVATLSALYARHSVREARRANEIVLHNEKLKIFKGILDLRAKLSANGVNIKEYELFSFYEYVQLSEFYFNKQIYEKVKEYFDCAWEVVKLRGLWEIAELDGDKKEKVQKTLDMLRQSREKADALETMLKEHLRVSET